MSSNIIKLQTMMVITLLFPYVVLIAAENDVPPDIAIPVVIDNSYIEPFETAPDDIVEAGTAQDAFKEPNPCEGRAQGKYLGPEVCDDCHQDKIDTLLASKHGQVADSRTPFGQNYCETCHGPGELHFKTEGNCIVSMSGRYGEPVAQRNAVCLGCHTIGDRMHWLSSTHEAEGLACVSCHSIHKPEDVMERTSQNEVCFSCHKDIRAQTFRASSHPIRENKVICSDCHNSHGSSGPLSLKQPTINENCYSCHAEKRGPFLWEHYPASEDCTLCHRVHGSNHRALLNKPGPQLCQQCHNVNLSGSGRTHVNNFLDFNDADQARARSVVGMNCANCHSKVHGSNHPSGSVLQR